MQKKYQQKGVKRGEKANRRDKTTTQTIFNDNGFLAGLGTKEENDNRNNNKQQRTTNGVPRGARKKMLSEVVKGCLGCRKKEKQQTKDNKLFVVQ